MTELRSPLPIDPHLPDLVRSLERRPNLVLVAEPGAGKTTRVPPALLDAQLGSGCEILVLQPRRLAARLAARRVAEERGERVGEQVGYQVRFEDVSSARTRIRFVTEGILTRRLAADPTLSGVDTVIFDELHERHLHADLGLSLLRALQRRQRPELRLVAMSATMRAEPVAAFLEAPVMQIEGRVHEVAVEHAEGPDDRPLERRVAAAVRRLAREGLDGDVLVFLPGAAEIRRAREACAPTAEQHGLELAMLHGDLPPAEQDRAVQPGPRAKILLSTNVAETSITVEGVVAVVDSGFARVAHHSPWSGLPRLETARISRASALQRAGRAGRLRPGRCVRLYTKHDFDTRPERDEPEIRRADLSEAVLMLRAMGHPPRTLELLDPPPEPALQAAETLLHRLGATGPDGNVTALGRRLAALPLHPRLGRLLLEARDRGAPARGCLVAALLGEREIRLAARTRVDRAAHRPIDEVGASDLIARLEAFEAVEQVGLDAGRIRAHELDVGAVRAVARARRQLARWLGCDEVATTAVEEQEPALLVATLAAFPDRVGRRRAAGGREVAFAEGGSAQLSEHSVVTEADLLVAVEVEERRRGPSVIRAASAIEAEWLLELFPDRIEDRRELCFDPATERVEQRHVLRYEGLVLDETRRGAEPGPQTAQALAEAALQAGIERFCDPQALQRLRGRVAFAAEHGLPLEPIEEDTLRETLASLCEGRTRFAELERASMLDALRGRLDPAALARLERFAPEHVAIAGRRRVAVQYEPGKTPWIASRLQDFFGMEQGPRIAEGQVPLVIHLLAPNRRALQVTTDLAGFWDRHYPRVRKELMRRYPKHAWPEDPLRPRP